MDISQTKGHGRSDIPPVTIIHSTKSGLDVGNLDAWQRTSKAFLALWWRVAGASKRPQRELQVNGAKLGIYLRHGKRASLKLEGFAPKNGGGRVCKRRFHFSFFLNLFNHQFSGCELLVSGKVA